MSGLSRYLRQRLVCPTTRQSLVWRDGFLQRSDGLGYPILHGVPCFRRAAAPSPTEPVADSPQVTLMIMTRDEEECIGAAIREAREVLDDLELSYEVLVVDGNSSDATVARAQECGARVIRQSSPGYSAGFQEGLRECTGEYIVTIDADLTHDPNFIRSLWQARNGGEVVIGSRYISYGGAQMPRLREFLSRALNEMLRRLLDIPVRDISSGLRLYHAASVKGLPLRGQEFDVLIEVLARYLNEGYLVREVPFFYKPRLAGETKVRLIRFAIAYLKATLRLFPLRHSPGAADYELRLFHHALAPGRAARQTRLEATLKLLDGAISDLAIVGCGASKLAVSLPGAVCVDDGMARLRLLRGTHTMLVHAEAHALPFADSSFRYLIAGPRLDGSEVPIDELLRVLSPGGELILATDARSPDGEGLEVVDQERLAGSKVLRKLRKKG